MHSHSILWRRLDRPGHEAARLSYEGSSWRLTGTAVFAHEQLPCRLDYQVICDAVWHTIGGRVAGWVGEQPVDVEIAVDDARRWSINGTQQPQVAGCVDLDLNFSPSTNLLPIRRLELAVSQEAQVKAAWLRFPSFTLEPLEQVYRRIDEDTYRYESAGGAFTRHITVNQAGFVTEYPGFWTIEAST